jgi:glycine betaine/proline transport system substrate-binding protein
MCFTIFILLTMAGVLVSSPASAQDKVLKLAYVEWSSEIASANMVKAVVEDKLGIECRITAMNAEEMWKAVADGTQDAMVAAWLPSTHAEYYKQYKDQLEDLGPNLEGTRIGMVIPDVSPGRQTGGHGQRNRPYITISSIEEVNEHAVKFKGRIVGIDPEAGVMERTRQAIKEYGLDNMRLIEGSEVAMTAELERAIQRKEWIVVTGWKPHWMFGRWTMKFLKDPKNVYGGEEHISTMVRKGLKKDLPEAYNFLDKFNWTPDEMDQVMVWNQMPGADPYRSAKRWMKYNTDKVQSWLK